MKQFNTQDKKVEYIVDKHYTSKELKEALDEQKVKKIKKR